MVSMALGLTLGLIAASEPPKSKDPRVAIERFAAEPDIVTPTGIAVDARGRVLVIESHTHFRPKDYDGPTSDRIRAFEDDDGDGRPERIRTFSEGTKHTMNLAVYRDGSVFVATRAEVFRLFDEDGDGVAERRAPIARLETRGDYPHNGLSGFAFDVQGNVYFGLGENLGASYKLIGQDGTTLSGGGEGGNVYRCSPDGRGLTRVATGFWNPFHLAFDSFGRLFAVDNDPDSRPPCRLLHVVEGGDFGYRFRNGRKGTHPFTAWDGELPGTLPMVAGTGEAPSGVVVYESDGLPADFRGSLLVTSWGDHRIDRFRLEPRGASFRAVAEPLITGGEDFRPVGIAVAPDGSLFVSDWVDQSYNVHGKGRIWRIRGVDQPRRPRPDDPRKGLEDPDRSVRERSARRLAGEGGEDRAELVRTLREHRDPKVRAAALGALIDRGEDREALRSALRDESPDIRSMAARSLPADLIDVKALAASDRSDEVRAEALRRVADPAAEPELLRALESDDPFLRQAARLGMRRSLGREELARLTKDESPRHRLGALLVLRELGGPAPSEVLGRALEDADPDVRFAAIEWVAEEGLKEFRPILARGLASGPVSGRLFAAYLAALERIDRGIRADFRDESAGEDYVARLLTDPATSIPARRRALRVLRPDHPALTADVLKGLLASTDLETRLEAVRTLRELPPDRRPLSLIDLAKSEDLPEALRAEAIVGISGDEAEGREALLQIVRTGGPSLRRVALRSLRGAELSAEQRKAVEEAGRTDEESRALAARVLNNEAGSVSAARSIDDWAATLDGSGDPAEGERVFFHPKGPGCYRCHRMDGRGGDAGPDLSETGRVLTRRRLIESIVEPAREVAPQFVPWVIAGKDGEVYTGLLLGESAEGEQTYVDNQGRTFKLKSSAVAERRPAKGSIMPDGLPALMTAREFRDLLAYLQGAGRDSRPDGSGPGAIDRRALDTDRGPDRD